ncbi:MAG TPA: DUF3263 domain-containing protein [Acidimicrobiales bacterium]
MPLTDAEKAILELERTWWSQSGDKNELIDTRLGIEPSSYYQQLNELIDRPDALEADPLVVRRLRRLRDRRRRARLGAVNGAGSFAENLLADAADVGVEP